MSKHTISRIPRHVLQILRTYESVSNRTNVYNDREIKNFMARSTDEYQRFHRSKLFKANEYREKDFSPIVRKHVDVLFEKPLDLGGMENLSTEDLFSGTKSHSMADPIYPSYFRTPKHSTDYYAKLLTSFASHYSPYQNVPQIETLKNSFLWYLKLLANTPVFFVLKQTHRLFSDSSLRQINKPLVDLQASVRTLGNSFVTSVTDESAVRNYHLTDLLSTDLLQLAIKNQDHFAGEEAESFSEIISKLDWSASQSKSDRLIEVLANRNIAITDSHLNTVNKDKLNELIDTQYFARVWKNASRGLGMSFPYDVKYDEFHLLTIENTILDNGHSELLETLEKSDFEIVAVRLSLQNALIYNFFKENIDASKKPSNYNELLKVAQETSRSNNFNLLMKGLGELSLVSVEESCNNNSIYLFPRSN